MINPPNDNQPKLRSLPDEAATLLHRLHAPPRLVAHLRLVHDVAVQLVDTLSQEYRALPLQADAIRFGAATHDIGKIMHPAELAGPGHQHEADGETLLLHQGVASHLARFARTHAAWRQHPETPLEDLLVALADTCWKGKRDTELEQRIVTHITEACGRDYWDVFLRLDDLVEQIAAEAETRLAWQAQFPVAGADRHRGRAYFLGNLSST